MKILKNNMVDKEIEKEEHDIFPVTIECENCGSELELDKSDIDEGYNGQHCVICPVCGKKSYSIDEIYPGNAITVESVEFPKHFYSFADGSHVSNGRIKEEIKRAVESFREEPESFCYTTGYGDFHITVLNFSGDKEYSITVCNKDGVYDAEIPFAKEDYDAQERVDWGWTNSPTSNTATKKNKGIEWK